MLIPKQFPQYVNERALFIVTGSEDAKLYLAGDGELTKVDEFRVTPPKFDASEKSLYPLKAQPRQLQEREFVAALSVRIKTALGRKNLNHAYLFTPGPLKNVVRKALPANVMKVLRKTTEGNYFKLSPTEILKKLSK